MAAIITVVLPPGCIYMNDPRAHCTFRSRAYILAVFNTLIELSTSLTEYFCEYMPRYYQKKRKVNAPIYGLPASLEIILI